MNYQQTLAYLYTQLPMYQRVGQAAMKANLNNILLLCEALGNPHTQFKSIHIAGTNGKGSTAHALAAILQQHGFKTGLYTSPHYRDFRERIKINGTYISEAAVIDFVAQHRSIFEDIRPSFFEITVALAFVEFARQKVDIAVIETGLGGRLDSTNIITPLLSIITNISFDHTNLLGDTLPLIAAEKAGIIKQNVPVVIGEYHADTFPVFKAKATVQNAPLYLASQHFKAKKKIANLTQMELDIYRLGELALPNLKTDLTGIYQLKNIATVLQAVEVLSKINFFSTKNPFGKMSQAAIYEALNQVKPLTNFMGRWQQIFFKKRTIIADSAHNPGGLHYAMQQLQSLDFEHLHIVLGAVKDKDIRPMLSFFPKAATYYFCRPNVPRGLNVQVLQATAAEMDLKGTTFDSVQAALDAAKQAATEADVIYVGGSTFVVAEVV